MRVNARNIRLEINDIDYEWHGSFGCVLKSYEKGIRQNDVRMIGNVVFYAYRAYKKRFSRVREISWVPQAENGATVEMEFINKFKSAVFADG